jgi:hypothetical protein
MPAESPLKPTFSRGRKWSIGFQVTLTVVMMLAIIVMVNYLSGHYFKRFYLSTDTKIELSPRTRNFLKSLTNDVKVILYYDRQDALYTTIVALLKEYQNANPKISVRTVDYMRDPGEAEKVKAHYKLPAGSVKDVVIFDCEGQRRPVPGEMLADYTLEQVEAEPQRKFRKKAVAFKGELVFTSVLLQVTNPKRLKAYFLQGHGEHRIDSDDDTGYRKCVAILQGQNYIEVAPLSLLGTNTVPQDCHLLVIAGATRPISTNELAKVEEYLNQGARLFVLFNNASSGGRETGLEPVLAKWGVRVSNGTVKDLENTSTPSGTDLIVGAFSKHPVVNSLIGSQIQLILPRPISTNSLPLQADAPRVEEIAFSGPNAVLEGNPSGGERRRFPLIVAVEKGSVKGVVTERGSTRMIVMGDSLCFVNHQIESGANSDFLGYAVNWLLERTQLLEGPGPRPMTEYRFLITSRQLSLVRWILLVIIPGGVLLLGFGVWLRRRR